MSSIKDIFDRAYEISGLALDATQVDAEIDKIAFANLQVRRALDNLIQVSKRVLDTARKTNHAKSASQPAAETD